MKCMPDDGMGVEHNQIKFKWNNCKCTYIDEIKSERKGNVEQVSTMLTPHNHHNSYIKDIEK